MTFNYTLTPPCSSAKPVLDKDGKIKTPLQYDGVGCPGVLTSTSYIINCNNGTYVGNSTDSCNGNINFKMQGNQCQNYFPMEYEELNLENRFNRINFTIGQKVFVQDIRSTLNKLLDTSSLIKFYNWNSELLPILNNLGGCGTNRILSGIIKVITNDILNDGTIKYTTPNNSSIELSTANSWPDEIFWLELDNGTLFGLDNFHNNSDNNNLIYTDDNINYNIHSLSKSKKLLFPVLREQITNLNTRLSLQGSNHINRSQIMNTPRFRSRGSCTTGSLCLDTTLTPGFKNSTKNMYLAPIPYAQRLGNTFRSSLIRGSKKIVRRNCVNPQFGRLVGTGGSRIVNKF